MRDGMSKKLKKTEYYALVDAYKLNLYVAHNCSQPLCRSTEMCALSIVLHKLGLVLSHGKRQVGVKKSRLGDALKYTTSHQ